MLSPASPPTSGKWLLLGTQIFLFIVAGAQEPSIPEEAEAPATLWEAQLGDQNVELSLEGSWEVQALGGTGLSLGKNGLAAPEGFPGLTLGWLLAQSPLLKLEIRMDRRYFFRVDYQGEWSNSSFLMGYEGLKDEAFRGIKIGTEAFSIPNYGDWTLGEGQKGRLQGALGWDSTQTSHDFLIRQETGKREVRTFRGKKEVHLLIWALDQWAREELYRLPGTPLNNLKFLVEDQSGLRVPRAGELSWSAETGELRPLEWKGHRIYASWEGIETSGLTLAETTTLPGFTGTFFIIDRIAGNNSRESKNIYRQTGPGVPKGDAFIRLRHRKTDDTVQGPWTFLWKPSTATLEVRGSDGSDHPFEFLVPGIYTGSSTQPGDYEIVAEVQSEQEGFLLPRNIIPGTMEIKRNGLQITSFTFSPETGALEFPFPIFPQDSLEVSYETASEAGSQVLGAQGNRWNIGPGHWIDLGFLFRWNWDQEGWTTEADQKPGRAQVFLDHRYNTDKLYSQLKVVAEGELADSTGLLRWYSADGEPFTTPMVSRLIRPGSRPISLQPYLGPGYLAPGSDNRGQLLYRDLSLRDFAGYAGLQAFSEDSVPSPYGPGEITGPYLAGGYQSQPKTLLVTEFRLKPGQWVASQNFFDEGRLRNMRSITQMSMHLKTREVLPPGVRVFFQLGELGEDLDGDGKIAQPDPDIPGLSFFDGTYHLNITLDPASLRSEDWQEKGWLVPDSQTPLTWEITGLVSSLGDNPWTVDLSESQRAVLARVNSYRIVVIAPEILTPGKEWEEGVLFSSAPVFRGSSLMDSGASFIEGPLPGTPWFPQDSTESNRLTGSNAGGLLVRWSAPGWKGTYWGKEVTPGQYRWFRFSSKNPEDQPFSGTIRLSDSRQRGYLGNFEVPPDNLWHHFRLNLETGEIIRDGQLTDAAVKTGQPVLYTDLEVTMISGKSSGTLMFDEFHFQESLFQTWAKGTWTGGFDHTPWTGLNFHGDWNLQAWSGGNLIFHPSAEVSAGPFILAGDTEMTGDSDGALDFESGYQAQVNWDQGLIRHRFRENAYRDEGLFWKSTGASAHLQTGTSFRKESTVQTLEAMALWGSGDSIEFFGELRGKFSQDSPAADFLEKDFVSQWTQSWGYSNWNLQRANRRTSFGQIAAGAPWGPFHFKIKTTSHWEENPTREDFLAGVEAESGWSSDTPIGKKSEDPTAWKALINWDRKIQASRPKNSEGAWDALLSSWSQRWKDYAPLLLSYPGREWWAGPSPSVGSDQEKYMTSFRLKLFRPRQLIWTDLLPGILESVIEREDNRAGAEWTQLTWENQLESSLINAFGSSGYLPIFTWYTTDQGFIKASSRFFQPAFGPYQWDFKTALGYTMVLSSASYGISSSTSWGIAPLSTTGQLWGEWSWDSPKNWRFPYVSPPRNYRPKLVNKLSMDYFGTGTRPLSRFYTEYTSRWDFTPQGSVLGSFKWGQDWNNLRYNTVLEAGIRIKLVF